MQCKICRTRTAAGAAIRLLFDMKTSTICKVAALVLSLVATQGSFADGQRALDPKVRAAQANLAHLGFYKGPIDGVYSQSTRDAIARYQANHKLPVTGKVTDKTLQSLGLLLDSHL